MHRLQEFSTRTNEDWRFIASLEDARNLTGAVAAMMVKPEAISVDVMLDLSTADSLPKIVLDGTAKTLTGSVPQIQMLEFVPGSYVFDVVVTYGDGSITVEANCKLTVI